MNALAQARESGAPPERSRRRPTVTGLLLAVVQLLILGAVLTIPLGYAWRHQQAVRLGLQHHTPASAEAAFAPLAGPGGLQVLTFHDITPSPRSPYAVTPQQFAETMQMLVDAGYTTATAADVGSVLAGRQLSGHRVLITFDDGARGIWTYADPVLKRLNLHAMAFIITGRVGTHQPYYVTWPQLTAMSRSGRWDLESHTDAAHEDVDVSAYGGKGPALANLRWLTAAGRSETVAEYTRRVSADLAASKAAFTAHRLPAPTMFAYPFSASGHPANDPRVPAVLRDVVRQSFSVAFDDETGAGAVGPSAAASRLVPRIEVLGTTTPAELYRYLRRTSPAAVAGAGLTTADDWSDYAGRPDLTVTGTRLRLVTRQTAGWQYALYGPSLAAVWPRYHLEVTVLGLVRRDNAAAVIVRASGSTGLRVTVTNSQLQIRTLGANSREIAHRSLRAAGRHHLVVDESPAGTTVTVDRRVRLTVRSTAALPAGGIGIAQLAAEASTPVPSFDGLTVTEPR